MLDGTYNTIRATVSHLRVQLLTQWIYWLKLCALNKNGYDMKYTVEYTEKGNKAKLNYSSKQGFVYLSYTFKTTPDPLKWLFKIKTI